jgi:hypothetical protein
MQEAFKRPILILITNSFAAINVIHSGLIKELAARYNIHLLSTMIHSKELAEINKHFNISLRLVSVTLPKEGTWLCILRKVEKALFVHHFDIVTQKIKYQKLTLARRIFIKIALQLLVYLHLNEILLKLLRRFIIFVTSFSSNLKQLTQYDFHGVISSSPLDIRENRVVNFLRRHGVKSLAMVISWDNLTSKGVINADHSYTLVWNKVMASEFRLFYSIFDSNEKTVKITGIPRFDVYFKGSEDSLVKSKTRYNVRDSAHIILIATSAAKHFPHQLEVIHDVLEFAQSHENVQVLIRCHPADDPAAYRSLAAEQSIILWHPKSIISGDTRFYEWFPELDFLDSLAEMLLMCDVCIQFASTMKLDAAACGKPVISIGYDGSKNLSYRHSAQRLYEYAHQLPLNDLGLDKLVCNKEQLFDALTESLTTKPNHQRAAIKPFIHFTKCESVTYTAKTIAEWLD